MPGRTQLNFENVDAICEAAMREHGLPDRIRTDNGSPFAYDGSLGPEQVIDQVGKSLGFCTSAFIPESLARMAGTKECIERLN
jgi:hypothetical protein